MALIINSRVDIPFRGILDTNPIVNLKGTDLDIFVDGVLMNTGQDLVKSDTTLTITFDAVYIQTQRDITFKTLTGTPVSSFVVKTQVYAADDIVVKEYQPGVDSKPILPTWTGDVVGPVNSGTQPGGTINGSYSPYAGVICYPQVTGPDLCFDSNGTPVYIGTTMN